MKLLLFYRVFHSGVWFTIYNKRKINITKKGCPMKPKLDIHDIHMIRSRRLHDRAKEEEEEERTNEKFVNLIKFSSFPLITLVKRKRVN